MLSWKHIEEAQQYQKEKRLGRPKMKITLEENGDKTMVKIEDKPVGIIKCRSGHLLCYSNGRHTTTQSLSEVIRFFNGDYRSYYNWQRE